MSSDTPEIPARRRQALGALGALGALAVAACGGGSSSNGSTAGASSNASLAGLSLSIAGISPAFSSDVTSYTLAVPYGNSTLSVTPTAGDSGATIRVNGSVVASGAASNALLLAVGSTTVSIVLTAADGTTTRTYTLVVTRTSASDASLAALALSTGTLSPSFASGTTSYTAAVEYATSSITVTATATSTAATVRINGTQVASGSASGAIALGVGGNTITLVVTAEDSSTTTTTTIVVTRAAAGVSNDATLSALAVSSGTLSPGFASATTAYTLSVANTVASVTVTPTSTSSDATIRVNGAVVASGSASAAIAVAAGGSATLTIVVTAQDGTTTRTTTVLVTRAAVGNCTLTPTETQGPYPLLAILSNSAMQRSDIRESKTGVPLTLTLTIKDLSDGCAPVAGAAVYVWHCDKDGLYSGYSNSQNAGQAGLTYLRGIQVTDANGQVTFTTIYPGWYAGRITHIHFQVYLNDNLTVTATATSQIAFPQAVTAAVYASALYTKGQNTSVTSFSADNVFSDGTTYQMASISGDTSNGYAASLEVTIA